MLKRLIIAVVVSHATGIALTHLVVKLMGESKKNGSKKKNHHKSKEDS